MAEYTKDDMDKFLADTLKLMRTHHTPEDKLGFMLNKEFYDSIDEEYWADYQKKNPKLSIMFFDTTGSTYKLVDGALIKARGEL